MKITILLLALIVGSATASLTSIVASYGAATTTAQAASDVRVNKLISHYIKALAAYEDSVRHTVRDSADLENLVAIQAEIERVKSLDPKAGDPDPVADVKLTQLRVTFKTAHVKELRGLANTEADLAKALMGYLKTEEQTLIDGGNLEAAIAVKAYREGIDVATFQAPKPTSDGVTVMVIANPTLKHGYARAILKDPVKLVAGVTYTFTAMVCQEATDSGLEAVDDFPVFLSETDVKGQFSSSDSASHFDNWAGRQITHSKQDKLGWYKYTVEFTALKTHKALMRFQTYMDRKTSVKNVRLTASDSGTDILPPNILRKNRWIENEEKYFTISFEAPTK